MRTISRVLLMLVAVLALIAGPALAERDLSINDVYLNGMRSLDIRVRPGERITGTVTVTVSSSSLFRTHTAVWLPSWLKTPYEMRTFLTSMGGVEGGSVPIDIYAPSYPGTYYLLFCFDRKHADAMYNELTSRSDEQIYANGRAVRVIVDGAMWPVNALFPQTQSTLPAQYAHAAPLEMNGQPQSGVAGTGTRESLWRITTIGLMGMRDDAVRIRVSGDQPGVDLDLEVIDQYGRRRGISDREGSFGEQIIARANPGEVLYARVFGFKTSQEGTFKIVADRVSAMGSRVDPSAGRASLISNGYTVTERAGDERTSPRWYAANVIRDGFIDVELQGTDPSREVDVWIYDDLGNLRAASRTSGSRLERATVDYAEAGTYYIKVGALRLLDESDVRLTFRVTEFQSSVVAPINNAPYYNDKYYNTTPTPTGDPGVYVDIGGIRIKVK